MLLLLFPRWSQKKLVRLVRGMAASKDFCSIGVQTGADTNEDEGISNSSSTSNQVYLLSSSLAETRELSQANPKISGPCGVKRFKDDQGRSVSIEFLEDKRKSKKRSTMNTRVLKFRRPGMNMDRYYETDYYFENGLRKVYPYFFTFTSFAKERWMGRTIIDIFESEFRLLPRETYEKFIELGRVTVNYEPVGLEYVIKGNDLMANTIHRHEVPVTAAPLKIVHSDENLIVIDKPSSIPIHPCGRYRHNSVMWILAKDHGLTSLHTLHRLDRLTSGLLLIARHANIARSFEVQLRNRELVKEYICRVDGCFPEEPVICKEPIECISFKIGVSKVSSSGKLCMTEFQRLSWNGKTSVVLCRPRTGRMHQIRVHLQYLGYPIVNDPLYNSDAFGPEKGKGGCTIKTNAELLADLIKVHNVENWLSYKPHQPLDHASLGENEFCPPAQSTSPPRTANLILLSGEKGWGQASRGVQVNGDDTKDGPISEKSFDPDKITFDPYCPECRVDYKDPAPSDLIMYLHAWRYKGADWEYETELPDWAHSDWQG
ncbi:unnamed protein product [Darwinula stevensoni]|uniref:Pseudouridylate synthase RPUSD2 n=1 Tax=Darwinula stevensoni TaxID=69355 RepID=A0A7R8XLP4_9CRUS|nr:unnamed protein product [Darwinula stevensoni]CAG0894503.1 unnamed protein product [Darwinula stevensoni]